VKLLLDQGLPRSAVGLLKAARFEALHVADAGRGSASDLAILEFAAVEGRVVVTLAHV
jgi:predicted nuclease of predicted toxin-antitoxin system